MMRAAAVGMAVGIVVGTAVLSVVRLSPKEGSAAKEGEDEGLSRICNVSDSMTLTLLGYLLENGCYEWLATCLWVIVEPEDGNQNRASRTRRKRRETGTRVGRCHEQYPRWSGCDYLGRMTKRQKELPQRLRNCMAHACCHANGYGTLNHWFLLQPSTTPSH